MKENKAFISYGHPNAGLIFDDSKHQKYPVKYYHIVDGNGLNPDINNSYHIFIYSGSALLEFDNGLSAKMIENTFAAHHGKFCLTGKFKAVAIEIIIENGIYCNNNYRAYTQVGGPLEFSGRLKYIDGCTDSLLVPPVKKGDPCLNHLHFPSGITQTPHTHPSHRIGIVCRGSGMCVTPFGDLPLEEGNIFVIKEYDGLESAIGLDGLEYEAGTHKFDTYSSHMDVIAFHPDSDFGPEDENHPMINKTIVHGVSANSIDSIKTK